VRREALVMATTGDTCACSAQQTEVQIIGLTSNTAASWTVVDGVETDTDGVETDACSEGTVCAVVGRAEGLVVAGLSSPTGQVWTCSS
jgi:hypothetical protein